MEYRQEHLSKLPKVDEALNDPRLRAFLEDNPRAIILEAVRETIEQERQRILSSNFNKGNFNEEQFFQRVREKILQKKHHSLRRVINATGIVLHTNLGRAKLPASACRKAGKIAAGYSTLEYNVKMGSRGSRHSHVESVICKITGAQAAMAVNNNAAAAMLCLSAMADNREVIVSRGELVEIGGSFRIPDIMSASGAKLIEVGTTNKTKLRDYEEAIGEDTAVLMKVHTSNYRIVGFTAQAALEELAALGKEKDLPVLYDMGSGLMMDLQDYGIHEPTVQSSLKSGIDVIFFSGDKLLGGPQAGIIAGKKVWIDKMKKHPLARVVRIDKMTLAALEDTFRLYLDEKQACREIPVLRMLTANLETMKARGHKLIKALSGASQFQAELVSVQQQVGGGSAPGTMLEGAAVKIEGSVRAEEMEQRLRKNDPPIIARIQKDCVHLDMRTVEDDEIHILSEAMLRIESEQKRSGAT